MNIATMILVAAAVFGLCFLVDKGFTKIFRGKAQHESGLSVRLSKRYGSFGLIIAVIGIAAIFAGLKGDWLLIGGGILMLLIGAALVVYYMTFGVFYDDSSFLYTSFGKKSVAYRYRDIQAQQLYSSAGGITIIELHMANGKTVQVHSNMEGAYPFLDTAFAGWCKQTGRSGEDCSFHDPANSCWFPPVEG